MSRIAVAAGRRRHCGGRHHCRLTAAVSSTCQRALQPPSFPEFSEMSLIAAVILNCQRALQRLASMTDTLTELAAVPSTCQRSLQHLGQLRGVFLLPAAVPSTCQRSLQPEYWLLNGYGRVAPQCPQPVKEHSSGGGPKARCRLAFRSRLRAPRSVAVFAWLARRTYAALGVADA